MNPTDVTDKKDVCEDVIIPDVTSQDVADAPAMGVSGLQQRKSTRFAEEGNDLGRPLISGGGTKDWDVSLIGFHINSLCYVT